MAKDLVSTLADLKEKEVLAIIQKKLDSGEDPLKILDDSRKAVAIVGQRYQDGEYFIPELVYSGEILKAIVEMAKPKLAKGVEVKRLGKIIIGTVAGDIHDIGKDIVTVSFDSMKDTIEAMKAAGLRDKVKIMVGGGTLDDKVREYVGADAFGRFASDAVSLAKKWTGGK
jgi:methanogenic corrinoid protein MtbC1